MYEECEDFLDYIDILDEEYQERDEKRKRKKIATLRHHSILAKRKKPDVDPLLQVMDSKLDVALTCPVDGTSLFKQEQPEATKSSEEGGESIIKFWSVDQSDDVAAMEMPALSVFCTPAKSTVTAPSAKNFHLRNIKSLVVSVKTEHGAWRQKALQQQQELQNLRRRIAEEELQRAASERKFLKKKSELEQQKRADEAELAALKLQHSDKNDVAAVERPPNVQCIPGRSGVTTRSLAELVVTERVAWTRKLSEANQQQEELHNLRRRIAEEELQMVIEQRQFKQRKAELKQQTRADEAELAALKLQDFKKKFPFFTMVD